MRTHLLDSSAPLTEGQDQIAICGAEVKQAAFANECETTFIGQSADDFIIGASCFRCKHEALENADSLKRYLYIATNGENVKSGRGGEVEA